MCSSTEEISIQIDRARLAAALWNPRERRRERERERERETEMSSNFPPDCTLETGAAARDHTAALLCDSEAKMCWFHIFNCRVGLPLHSATYLRSVNENFFLPDSFWVHCITEFSFLHYKSSMKEMHIQWITHSYRLNVWPYLIECWKWNEWLNHFLWLNLWSVFGCNIITWFITKFWDFLFEANCFEFSNMLKLISRKARIVIIITGCADVTYTGVMLEYVQAETQADEDADLCPC